jgi:rubrerythrin
MIEQPCVSLEDEWKEILSQVVGDPLTHAKWLNTLSYLENCGARKIAACEHPTKVKTEMLKHAAEEFRHAYYLKSQIKKVIDQELEDYSLATMLGGVSALHYLQALDVLTCQHLKREEQMSPLQIREAAYILVTYAVELRASELYPLYHEILKAAKCKVAVKSILLEEEEHLAEMKRELDGIPGGDSLIKVVCSIESQLCKTLIHSLRASISTNTG